MSEPIQEYILSNGMTLLAQPVKHVQSASFYFLMPGGSCALPDGAGGAGNILQDWIFRGAGPYDSRQLMDILDGLGLHRGASAAPEFLSFSSSMEAGNLPQALDCYAEVLLRPHFKPDKFELSKQQALLELDGLEDDPRQKVMLNLYEQFYPDPLGRSPLGSAEQIQASDPDRTSQIYTDLIHWPNVILAAAGNLDAQALCDQLEKLFGRTESPPQTEPAIQTGPGGYRHLPNQGSQVHIGFMTAVPSAGCDPMYAILAAVNILSGGMSSRLFTEVREKRGLCYAVGARYHTLRNYAGISGYAGTTPEKAQETLDVILAEFRRLSEGITEDEMDRAKIGLKSSLVMQNESTSARTARMASDRFMLHRVRTLDEIRAAIESLTRKDVLEFLEHNPFDEFTVVTIGPKNVQVAQS